MLTHIYAAKFGSTHFYICAPLLRVFLLKAATERLRGLSGACIHSLQAAAGYSGTGYEGMTKLCCTKPVDIFEDIYFKARKQKCTLPTTDYILYQL